MGRKLYNGTKGFGSVRIGDNANLADAEVIVLGSKTYEWNDTEGDIVAGRVWLNRSAGSDALCAAELVAKINANKPSKAVTAYVDPVDTKVVRIETDKQSDAGQIAFTTTMGDSDNVIAAVSNKLGGAESSRNRVEDEGEYPVNAIDILAANIMIPTALQTPRFVKFECFASTGEHKAITWRATISGTRIKISSNGATAPIAGDVIRWQACE